MNNLPKYKPTESGEFDQLKSLRPAPQKLFPLSDSVQQKVVQNLMDRQGLELAAGGTLSAVAAAIFTGPRPLDIRNLNRKLANLAAQGILISKPE